MAHSLLTKLLPIDQSILLLDSTDISWLPSSLLLAAAFLGLAPVLLVGNLWMHFATRRAFPNVKMTALKIVLIRAELNRMGLRRDDVSEKLLQNLPWIPPLARWAAFCHLPLARFLHWHTFPLRKEQLLAPRWRDVVTLRTMLIDKTVQESSAPQLVILGAGFDTRAFLPTTGARRRFEVDIEPTQAAKMAAVKAAGIALRGVTFVSVDFNRESWLDKLIEAGFDPAERAVIVLEGVTYYLQPEAVDATVALIRTRCAPGTELVLDYFSTPLVNGELIPLVSKALARYGEPLLCGIGSADEEEPALRWAKERGLTLTGWLPGGKAGKRWGGVLAVKVPASSDL